MRSGMGAARRAQCLPGRGSVTVASLFYSQVTSRRGYPAAGWKFYACLRHLSLRPFSMSALTSAALLGLAILIYLGLRLFIQVVGGTVKGGLRSSEPPPPSLASGRPPSLTPHDIFLLACDAVAVLLIWLMQTVQVVSEVSRVSSSQLPPLLQVRSSICFSERRAWQMLRRLLSATQAVYRAVALIQLQGIILPPVRSRS